MINLLPPEKKQDIKYGRLNIILIQYVVLAMVVTVTLLGIVVLGSNKLSSVQKDIQKEVKASELKVNDLRGYHEQAQQISNQVQTLSNLFSREVKFSELLTSIGGVMPTGSSLTQLTLSDDRTLPLSLTADVTSEEVAAVLRKNLEESDIFEKADIVSLTAQNNIGSDYKFQVSINAVLTGAAAEAKAKEDAQKATEKKKGSQ